MKRVDYTVTAVPLWAVVRRKLQREILVFGYAPLHVSFIGHGMLLFRLFPPNVMM